MKCIYPDWPAPKNIKSFTTTRKTWGQSNPKSVEEQQRFVSLFNLPEDPIWLTQTHSNQVVAATPENKNQNADAAYTSQPQRICVVLTGDCLPILICNRAGTIVSAIHAGWRGMASGIIENTLQAMQSPADSLLVWLGPAISQQKYEVGRDVYEAFINQCPEAAPAFQVHKPEKWLADLYQIAKIKLNLQGISAIFGGNFCTYQQDDLFFSARREKEQAGRMASLIWME